MREYPETVQIVLMGLSGSGKSNFYNSLTSVPVRVKHVRTASFDFSFKTSNISQIRFQLLDTPGTAQTIKGLSVYPFLKKSRLESGHPSAVILWFVDFENLERSVRYISAHAPYLNSSVSSALHYLVVSKQDKYSVDFSTIEVSIDRRIQIQGIFHCSATDPRTVDSIFRYFDSMYSESVCLDEPSEVHLHEMMILGPSHSGKSSLLRKKVWKEPPNAVCATIGLDVFDITLSRHAEPDAIACWDLSGEEVKGHMWSLYKKHKEAFLFCVDVSSSETIQEARDYLNKLCRHSQLKDQETFLSSLYLVFTKVDRSPQLKYDILAEAIKREAGVYIEGCPPVIFETEYFVTSAQDNTGILEMFQTLHQLHFKEREEEGELLLSMSLAADRPRLQIPQGSFSSGEQGGRGGFGVGLFGADRGALTRPSTNTPPKIQYTF